MPEIRVSPRERMVLTAIIELYIATGEPVASQAVADQFAHKEGLSSATIRNVMASLGDAGLLEQPHTSSGRVPTAGAFRYYVEQITRPDAALGRIGVTTAIPVPGSSLSEQRRGQIEEIFSGVTSSNEYLERTSHVLALISSGLGVALASGTGDQVLEHIHFSRLSAGRVLAVVVTQSGAVLDRVLVLDREMTTLELDTAGRYLNETFHGWPIERIRTEIARRMDEERTAYNQLLTSVEELCRKGALTVGEGAQVLIAGWRWIKLAHAAVALVAFYAGMRIVKILDRAAGANQEHVNPPLYMVGKIPWNFSKNLLGFPLWNNLNKPCEFPVWQTAIHIGGIRSVGVCSFAPAFPMWTLSMALATFGLFPIVLIYIWQRQRSSVNNQTLLIRFCVVYGVISFVLAPMLGASVPRLFSYAWPLFLVVAPILAQRCVKMSSSTFSALLAIHIILGWLTVINHSKRLNVAIEVLMLCACVAAYAVAWILLYRSAAIQPLDSADENTIVSS